MKAVLAGRTGTSTDEGGQVKPTTATERLQDLDISSLDGDTAKALLHKILTSLEDVAKMKSSTTTAEEQNRPKSGSSSPPDEVRRASEILLGMRGVDQSSAATCQDTANAESPHQTGKNETNAPSSFDDLASRTKSAISTLADLCTALRDAEPQVVNEVLPRRYHHLVPSTSAPTLLQAVAVPGPRVSPENTVVTEPPTLPSPVTVAQVPSPKRIFIPGMTAIRPMPDYCRVIFHPSSPDMDNRKRRARTVFSAQQLKRLEEEYKKCSYPDKERRQSVADATGLTEGCVRIWYQNRRAKDHRLKDSERQREGASVSSTSQPEMPGIISSRPVEPVSRLPPSDTAPPSATLNRAEEAAMEALVNLSSTTSAETTASHNPNDSLNSAAQSDEALADTNIKSSAPEIISSCKIIDEMSVSKSELVEQSNVANLQLAAAKKENPFMIQNEHNRKTNTKFTPATDSSTIDKPPDDVRRATSEHVAKTSGATSQQKSQRAMIASLVAQTLKHSEGPDCKRTVVPIAVVNIPIVRVDGSTGEGVDGSGKGSEKMKPVPYVATRVPVPTGSGEQLGGSKGGRAPQSGEAARRATAIGIPFQALQFQNQWTKKSSNVNQKHDSSTTVTAKIHPDVLISTAPTITRTATSSSASKVSSLLGFLISDPQANAKQLARSSKPTVQDAKHSEKGCSVDKEKAKLPNSQIPSTIVLRLQPRATTMTAKPCSTAGKPTKDSEQEMGQPTSSKDDFSSTTPGKTDRKRKVSEAERVNKGTKVVQTQMWRELTEEKTVAKKSKNVTKGSKKTSPSQVFQPSTQGNQYGNETHQEKEIPTKETARGSNTYGESKQPKLSTDDTKHPTDACTVESSDNTLNLKNSHPTTLHYKKGRVCQCHQLQEIIDYCVRKGSETAKIDNSCSTTKDAGSLQRPREGKGQPVEPPRQVPRSGDSVPKTWASGTVRHLKITTPISIATTGRLANVRSFTRSRVPVGSARAMPVTTNTQHGGFHRPTPASFRHVNLSKKPCPLPATVIPKSTPAATGQLFLKNQKTAVQLKTTRGVRVVVSHPSNNVIMPTLPVCTGHTYTSPPTFTRPTVGAVSQRAHPTCGAAAMFRLGSVLKRPNASTFRLPLVMKPVERKTTAATTGYVSSGIRLQPVQNRGQLAAQPGGVNRPPPLPQGDGDALRRLQRFTDGFLERHRSSAPSTESRRDDRPPPAKVRRTDI